MDSTAVYWFLSGAEREHSATGVHAGPAESPAWSEGNLVRPLIHGATYFARLHEGLTALQPGDRVWFTGWSGDGDERLTADGGRTDHRGIDGGRTDHRGITGAVGQDGRGSPRPDLAIPRRARVCPMSNLSNEQLSRQIDDTGGEVLLDQRVRVFGCHHQKLFVIRSRSDASRDVAFVGGIDLSHSRRDDADHRGDPQAVDMDPRYGKRRRGTMPPSNFAARLWQMCWNCSRNGGTTPIPWTGARRTECCCRAWLTCPGTPSHCRTPHRRRHRLALTPCSCCAPTGEASAVPVRSGRRAQRCPGLHESLLTGTFADLHRGPIPAVHRGRCWNRSCPGTETRIERDRRGAPVPGLRRPLGGPPKRLRQLRVIETIRRAAPDRFGVFNLENRAGTPVYVHAKICIIDVTWFTCGSDNFNRQSWTTDSELTCAVIDTSAGQQEAPGAETGSGDSASLAQKLRRQLWAEHLGLGEDDPRFQDPADGLGLWNASADVLDDWHQTGRRSPRPKGHARHHITAPVPRLQRLWAGSANRFLVDPDGRPHKLRGTTRF